MHLPQELLDHCIDKLLSLPSHDSFPALLACSLAGRPLLHRCRQHLFASVSTSRAKRFVFPVPFHSRLQGLEDVLSANPLLSQYIRHFHLDLGFSGSTFTQLDLHLPHIVELLLSSAAGFNLHSLELSSRNATSSAEYTDFTPNLKRCLQILQETISITTLTLKFFLKAPLSLLFIKSIRNIYLEGVTFSLSPPIPDLGHLAIRSVHIDHLLLDEAALVAQSPELGTSLGILLSGIEELVIRSMKWPVRSFNVLPSAAASLTNLDLSTASCRLAFRNSFPQEIDLDDLPSLKKLSIFLYLVSGSRSDATTHDSFIRIPTKPSQLARLKIAIAWGTPDRILSLDQLEDERGWSAIANLLRSPNLPSLLLADFEILTQIYWAPADSLARQMLDENIPDSQIDRKTVYRKAVRYKMFSIPDDIEL